MKRCANFTSRSYLFFPFLLPRPFILVSWTILTKEERLTSITLRDVATAMHPASASKANPLFLAFIYATTHKNYNIACTGFSIAHTLTCKAMLVNSNWARSSKIKGSRMYKSTSNSALTTIPKLQNTNYRYSLVLPTTLLSKGVYRTLSCGFIPEKLPLWW